MFWLRHELDVSDYLFVGIVNRYGRLYLYEVETCASLNSFHIFTVSDEGDYSSAWVKDVVDLF